MTKDSWKKGDYLRKNNHLSDKQKKICYGALLGDSNLHHRDNGQCSFKICHCKKQLGYLEWKKNLLLPFIIQDSPTVDNNNSFGYGSSFIYTSIVHQDFTDMVGLFYRKIKGKRNRYITMKTLKLLNPLSILIWYLDDGTLTIDKEMRLCSNAYSLSEHKTMKSYFWKNYRIETKIAKFTHKHTGKIYYFLRFNVENSKKLRNLFEPFIDEIPECMRYKLLPSTTIRETLII
jgi:hypothetical protein